MLKKMVLTMIRLYQKTHRFRLPACRFYPSCSSYTLQAVEYYGVLKGGWLAVKRICRCHPFHAGGYDPVPIVNENESGDARSSSASGRHQKEHFHS